MRSSIASAPVDVVVVLKDGTASASILVARVRFSARRLSFRMRSRLSIVGVVHSDRSGGVSMMKRNDTGWNRILPQFSMVEKTFAFFVNIFILSKPYSDILKKGRKTRLVTFKN